MIKKIYKLSLVAFLGFGSLMYGQVTYDGAKKEKGSVGVNVDAPQATLDIRATGEGVDGVLIPRVTTERAKAMGTNVAEATLVYITDGAKSDGTTSLVDGKGFYYFDRAKTKWIKVGGGVSESKKIQALSAPVSSDAVYSDTYLLIVNQGGEPNISLPNPADYPNRILAVNNQTGEDASFVKNPPKNFTVIAPGSGFLLMSDGQSWYVAAGLY